MNESLLAPILVSGVDARSFLQGQLSADVEAQDRHTTSLASINSAQGRVQGVLTLSLEGDAIAIWVVASLVERIMQRLRKYVLRSKVTIEDARGRAMQFKGSATHDPVEFWLEQVRRGAPHVFPETYESFVAQMLNLDLLGGINFEKGCYTGQEIIARAHYRGAVKRRMFRFAVDCSAPSPGTRIHCNDEHAGDVVYAAETSSGCELLAVVSVAKISSSLTLNAVPLRRLTLPYDVPTGDRVGANSTREP